VPAASLKRLSSPPLRPRNAIKQLLPARYRPGIASLYRRVIYAGNRVECPCCGGRFRRFGPEADRPDAKCPKCGSLERHRVLWLWFQDRTNLLTDRLRVLHVAPERALQRRLARLANLDYLSADLDSPLADVQLDVTDIGFDDASFDVVICNHVLEHVPDDRTAMRELRRVLKPSGWAVLMIPYDRDRAVTFEDRDVVEPEDRERVFGQRDHVRIYGHDYVGRLRDAGFEVAVERYDTELDPRTVALYGLRAEEIFHCRRPSPDAD
jgi:SAM-dependent methyltransferase